MTRVDFYTGSADKLRTACQLSHKAMQHGLRIVISLPDSARLDAIDKLLWLYPETGFIPHCRIDTAEAADTPVILTLGDAPFLHRDILISLHDTCLPFFSHFDRVIEIVGTEDSASGRARYKFYRDSGCELRHFDLTQGP